MQPIREPLVISDADELAELGQELVLFGDQLVVVDDCDASR